MHTLRRETLAGRNFCEVKKIREISEINFREWSVTMLFAKI